MSQCCCQSTVATNALDARQRRVLAWVLAINAATFVMLVLAWRWSGSTALLSGALDNLGDALTYAVSFAVVAATTEAKARVALLKGLLILGAAFGVAIQIGWRLLHPETPLFEVMGMAAILNLAANGVCLALLTPYRHSDVNMSSVWECSRNDVVEGVAVIATSGLVWLFASGWPDVLVASALLVLFLSSALRVLKAGYMESGWAGTRHI
ncbi:MAG: cation transporter [Gammaproteobacteria bacterium]|nr:cation transporter [Gammaproteobacteria bacterium]